MQQEAERAGLGHVRRGSGACGRLRCSSGPCRFAVELACRLAAATFVALCGAAILAAPSHAAFGFKQLDIAFTEADGSPANRAGSHPYAWTTTLSLNTTGAPGEEVPDQALKDLRIKLPPGLVGTPALLPRCSRADFRAQSCPDSTEVGTIGPQTNLAETEGFEFPLYSLEPLPGSAAELGFVAVSVPVIIEIQINPEVPHNLIASISNASQVALFYGSTLTVHGVPAEAPFLTLPRRCADPLTTVFEADSWQAAGTWISAQPSEPLALSGCDGLGFSPTLTARPSTAAAASPAGLDLNLDTPVDGLTSASGTAQADISKATLTLPEGISINPSLAAGLGGCGSGQLGRETLNSAPGEGCPNGSKIGTAEVSSPLLEAPVRGAVFVAQPDDPATVQPGAENPFDSLFAIYIVFRDAERGVLVKQAAEVQADPRSGRLAATLDEIPQLPFGHFELRLRAGPRAPLTTPGCGTHDVAYELTPSSGAAPLDGASSFTTGLGCGRPAFNPVLSAGSMNHRGGADSPFVLELGVDDGEPSPSQLSLTLPPGLSADFGSVPACPEPLAVSGGCPPESRIGYARIAAGSGPAPLWIPEIGKAPSAVYLAGPYRNAPFSLLIEVPAQAGPYDLGQALSRAAVHIDPETAQAHIAVDPLPQILEGIPIDYRVIRLVLDRAGFVRNPTSCEPMRIDAMAVSTGKAVAKLSERFQVASCARLRFRPRLKLRFGGGTGRNGHPTVSAVVRPRPGHANLRRASVLLPRGVYLDPSHIRKVCSREEFRERRCPARSRHGWMNAWSPLLAEPLQGKVYLRESPRRLPDLAVRLRGAGVSIALAASLTTPHGRPRATFVRLPDVPFNRLKLVLRGSGRGLLVNSERLCRGKLRLLARFSGHNGKRRSLRPRPRCQSKHRRQRNR